MARIERAADAIERNTIDAFIVPARRARLSALAQKPGGRQKFKESVLGRYVDEFDHRWMERLKPGQFPETICEVLRQRGAPETCHVLGYNDMDGREVPLRAAIERVSGSGSPALLICIPGELALLETEFQDERYVLERRPR